MLYFDHSTSASTDPKVMQLRLEHGGAAVDAYWYLVEQMHRDEEPICVGNASVMRVHSHTLCTTVETLREWVNAMVEIGLFNTLDQGDEFVFSERAMGNIGKYQDKCEKARSAAKSKWEKADAKQTQKRTQSKRTADGMPTKQSKTNSSNAIKSITTTDTAVAAAAVKTAPPADQNEATPHCPLCDTVMWKDTLGSFHCDFCHDSFRPDKVVWR